MASNFWTRAPGSSRRYQSQSGYFNCDDNVNLIKNAYEFLIFFAK